MCSRMPQNKAASALLRCWGEIPSSLYRKRGCDSYGLSLDELVEFDMDVKDILAVVWKRRKQQ